MFPRISITLLLTAALAHAQSETPLTVDRPALKGTVAESTQFAGRPAIRLLEADKSRNTLGLAVVNGLTFRDAR